MRDQELIGLYEAYQQVHTQQQVINEEVEIASHYFCEMGLNEIGVQILIEELGVEEFAEFVYDISEDYYLTEARAGGVMIKPVTTKGTSFKGGKPTGKSLERLRREKDKRKEAEASERPSGMKAALQRQDAMVSASKKQPQRKGALRSIAGFVLKGLERHKAATDGMGAATRETAGKIGKAAREFGTGLMSSYDNWVGQLISDGYDLSNWTDEGLFEYYEQLCEENGVLGRLDTLARDTAGRVGGEIGARRGRERLGNILGIPEKIGREQGTEKGQAVYDRAKETVGGLLKQSYEYDLYDTILEYLISEGYADTNENALVIMANMSEDWKQSIVEETLDERNRGEEGMSDREVSRRRNLGGNTRSEVSSSSLGDHGPQGAIQKFHNVKSKQRKEIHKTSRGLRGDTGESGGKGRYEANKDHKDGYPSITKRGQGPS